MAIQTVEKNINGAVYSCTQLPARRALKLKAKLVKAIGPTVAQLFGSSKDDGSSDHVVKAIQILSQTLNENEFEGLVVELLQCVRKDGIELVPAIIDMEFAGDFDSLYKVLWFVLETNFSSFFSMLGIGNVYPEPKQNLTDMKRTYMQT